MRSYKPRRATARWMEDAPEYVLSVHDNKGATADRYTVYFGGSLAIPGNGPGDTWVQYLALSGDPTSPQGVSMWGELRAYQRPTNQRVRWLDLPEHVRSHVIARATED